MNGFKRSYCKLNFNGRKCLQSTLTPTPNLIVDGFGYIGLPPMTHVSSHNDEETIVDADVRNTWEISIGADKITTKNLDWQTFLGAFGVAAGYSTRVRVIKTAILSSTFLLQFVVLRPCSINPETIRDALVHGG